MEAVGQKSHLRWKTVNFWRAVYVTVLSKAGDWTGCPARFFIAM